MSVRRWIVVYILLFSLAASLGACSPIQIETASSETDNQIESKGYTEKLTYTMNILYSEYAGKDFEGHEALNYQYFCDMFNIDFDFWEVSFSDLDEKCRIWIYSGDMPDLLFIDIAPARFNEYAKAAKAGAFRALPELEAQYPNLHRYVDDLKSTDYLTIDTELYTLPRSRDTLEQDNVSYWAYIYRKDWAEKLGLSRDDDIYTLDEWLRLNKAFVNMDPGDNGPGQTIGMGAPKWALPKFMGGGSINPYFTTYGKVDGRYVWGPAMDESIELVKTFKKMYDDGIIWRDMLIGRGYDSMNMYCAGLMGALPQNCTVDTVSGFTKLMMQMSPEVEDYDKAVSIALVRDVNGHIYADQTEDYWSSICFNAVIDDDKFDRILTAYDWFESNDGKNFKRYGVPDIDWTNNSSDGIVLNWAEGEGGTKVYPYPSDSEWWMATSLKDNFFMDSPIYPIELRNKVKDMIGKKLSPDSNFVEFNYDLMFSGGEEFDKTGTMEAEIVDALCEMLINSNNIEEDWTQWIKKMETKFKPVEDELNRMIIN